MTHRRILLTKARQNLVITRSRYNLWFVVFALFACWYLLLYVYDWSFLGKFTLLAKNFPDRIESKDTTQVFETTSEPLHNTQPNITKPGDTAQAFERIRGRADGTHPITKSEETTGVFERMLERLNDTHPITKPEETTRVFEIMLERLNDTHPITKPEETTRVFERMLERLNDTRPITKPEDPAPVFEPIKPDDTTPVSEKTLAHLNGTHPITKPEEEPPVENDVAKDWVNQINKSLPIDVKNTSRLGVSPVVDSCAGRYIYVHDIPSRFNEDMLKQCSSLAKWMDMCRSLMNKGLGQRLSSGWFATNQFSLEVIFHNRVKQYECLTKNSSKASAIFVPYYAGLEVGRYLWGGFNTSLRDSASLALAKWLRERPEWKVMHGRDHFMVAGRISWDFRRVVDEDTGWGNKLMLLPEAKNMTILTIEASPWHSNNFAIPYPTYFHPSSDSEVLKWRNKVAKQDRRFLFSFAGAPRPNMEDSIRSEIIKQCEASGKRCRLLHCYSSGNRCHNPVYVMRMFQSSEFCLQPPGDSLTRRSTFDSILAGCIPVFFHPGSAYVQYLWHLPKNFSKYSVLIPEEDVKNRNVSILRTLLDIPKAEVNAMREEVIKLIPRVIYADTRSRSVTFEDAFDVTVKGVLERIETVRRNSREGRSSFEIGEDDTWKYNILGMIKDHEWDRFFLGASKVQYWKRGMSRGKS